MIIMKNALVILAGGKGLRFGKKIPKQFIKYDNYNFIEYILNNISLDKFDIIVIACEKKYLKNFDYKNYKKKIIFSKPGKNRQNSSYNSLKTGISDIITGHPHDIASKGGRPKPS